MKNLYYVTGTECVRDKNGFHKKNPDGTLKEDTDLRAVIATDMENLQDICDNDYIRWTFERGPYPLSKDWR
jgi:hypothetical protein